MACQLIRTEAFREDFLSEFEGKLAQSAEAAETFARKVKHVFDLIALFPQMAPVSRKPHLHERGYREYYFDSYSLVYKVVNDEVLFLRLLHQSQRAEGQMVDWEE